MKAIIDYLDAVINDLMRVVALACAVCVVAVVVRIAVQFLFGV